MIKKDNPAGRLHELLTKTMHIANVPIRQVWAKVFEVEENDTIAIYYNLAHLHNLTIEIEQMISRIPDANHELFLRNMGNIRKALSWPNIGSLWNELKNVLTEQAVTDLAFCAEEIDKFYKESAIPEEELENIKVEIDKLFKQLSDSTIDLKLKITLQDLLEAMRRAVNEYHIRGAKGMREVIDYSLGSILRHREDIKNDNHKQIIKNFTAFLVKVDDIVARAIKYAPLLEFASKFFLNEGKGK